jgi:hypothetical protein
MKKIVLLAAVLFVFAALLYIFGGRLLTSRYRVAEFKWKLPTGETGVLSEDLALKGINLTLSNNAYDPLLWMPTTDNAHPEMGILQRNPRNSNSARILLTNRTSSARLRANLEMDMTNRVLEVVISRPK